MVRWILYLLSPLHSHPRNVQTEISCSLNVFQSEHFFLVENTKENINIPMVNQVYYIHYLFMHYLLFQSFYK